LFSKQRFETMSIHFIACVLLPLSRRMEHLVN